MGAGMEEQQADPVREFAQALSDLYAAAGSPPLQSLAKHAALQTPRPKVSVSSLSEWLKGSSVPSSDRAVRIVVDYLCTRRKFKDSGHQCPGRNWWEATRGAAQRYRKAEGARKPQQITSRPVRGSVWFAAGELRGHWNPRARGVERGGEPGWYFTGRSGVLRELVDWLTDDAPDGRVHVVTGGPGSGKSAVLARIVTLADPDARAGTPLTDAPDGAVPPVGCVDVAILARGRSASDVLARIAAVVGADLAAADEDRQLDVLVEHFLAVPAPLTVVVDALDEAAEPEAIAHDLRKFARDAAPAGVRVLVATRPGSQGRLLTACGHDAKVIDLDCEPWLHRDDLAGYVCRRLLAADDPHSRSPYRDRPDLAARVADAVASRAFPTFLIAQLVSRALTDSETVVDPATDEPSTRLPGTVADALDDYLFRFGPDHTRVRDLLVPLAYAHGTGLARDAVWVELAGALANRIYTLADLDWLLTTAADFLVEQTVDDDTVHHRLYHQALVDYLRPPHTEGLAQRRITRALTALAPIADGRADWAGAPAYVRRYLPRHAVAADLMEPLLDDAGFLLAAEHGSLRTALIEWRKRAPDDQNREQFHPMISPDPLKERPRRAAELEQRARQAGFDRLADDVAQVAPHRPWATPWAHLGLIDVDPHGCRGSSVQAAAVAEVDGKPALVHSGRGHLVVRRLSDGRHLARLGAARAFQAEEDFGDDWCAHLAWVYVDAEGAPDPFDQGQILYTVASGRVGGQTYVVAGDEDGTVRLWHMGPAASCAVHVDTRAAAVDAWRAGMRFRPLRYNCWIRGGAVVGGDRPMVVVAELGGEVHFLDLSSGSPVHPTGRHPGLLWTSAAGEVAARPVVLTAGTFGIKRGCVQMWDPVAGVPIGEPMLHEARVRAVTITTLHGLTVAVTRADGGEIGIWDLATRQLIRRRRTGLESFHTAQAVTEIAGRRVLVCGTGSVGNQIDLFDLPSLEHLDSVDIGSEVMSLVAAGQLVVVGCVRGMLALRFDDTWCTDHRSLMPSVVPTEPHAIHRERRLAE